MKNADSIHTYFNDLATGRKVSPDVRISIDTSLPSGIKGALNGILSRAAKGNENRKLVLKWLSGHTSSKDLTQGQWYALYCLVLPFRDPLIGWISDNPRFEEVVGIILMDLGRQDGQTEMIF